MSHLSLAAVLGRQFETSRRLLEYHLEGLDDDECLWRPSPTGPHVHRVSGGRWVADWPESESYDVGPPSIAWIGWHLIYWVSVLNDRSFGDGTLDLRSVTWPGSATAMADLIRTLLDEWTRNVFALDDEELQAVERSRWPEVGIPFVSTVAWSSVELAKNAAEIGIVRFFYGSR